METHGLVRREEFKMIQKEQGRTQKLSAPLIKPSFNNASTRSGEGSLGKGKGQWGKEYQEPEQRGGKGKGKPKNYSWINKDSFNQKKW